MATAVRLPVSVHERLHDAAADRDVSANLLVTRAVTEFLDRLVPVDAAVAGHVYPERHADEADEEVKA